MNHKIWNITIGTERANRMVDYTGMTRVLDNGKEATIIRFGDFYDIDVQLCTGGSVRIKHTWTFRDATARHLVLNRNRLKKSNQQYCIC